MTVVGILTPQKSAHTMSQGLRGVLGESVVNWYRKVFTMS